MSPPVRALVALALFTLLALAGATIALLDAFPGGRALPWAITVASAGFAVAPLAAWRTGHAALATAVRGSALAAGTLVLLRGLVDPFAAFADDAAFLVLAFTAFAVADRVTPRPLRASAWAASAAFFALAWTRLPDGVDALPAEPWRARVVVAAGAITVVVTALVRGALARDHGGPAGFARALTESPLRNLLVVVPLTIVLAYRRVLADVLPHIQIYEWGLGLALAFYAVAALRARHRDAVADAPWASEAARHVARVEPRPDAALDAAKHAFAFVDTGTERAAYAAWWRAHGTRAGVPPDAIERQLARLDEASTDEPRLWSRARKRDEDATAIREAVHRALLAQVANAPDPRPASKIGAGPGDENGVTAG